MLPLLADLIHARDCKPICEKLLTLPIIKLCRYWHIRKKRQGFTFSVHCNIIISVTDYLTGA